MLSDQLQLLLRILCLEVAGQLRSQIWDAISSLQTHSKVLQSKGHCDDDSRLEYIKRVSGTTRTQEEIKDLYSRVSDKSKSVLYMNKADLYRFCRTAIPSEMLRVISSVLYYIRSRLFSIMTAIQIPSISLMVTASE